MKILVANLGSTSFKYRLFDFPSEQQLAKGAVDRIGGEASSCVVEIGDFQSEETKHVANHAEAVQACLAQLTDAENGCLSSVDEVAGIGFKAVFAGDMSGVRRVDEPLLVKMESLSDIAPAHNPPYVRAMRELMSAFPDLPLVAAFETEFHETIPEPHRTYAVPAGWTEQHEIRRWGFHGASHRYVSGRLGELTGKPDLKVVCCHLGGSSSLCATDSGRSVAASMGMSPQSGLPQNNRVGDIDPFTIPVLMKKTGATLEELLEQFGSQGGLLGLSGLSGDVRDLEAGAAEGHSGATLALDHYVAEIRRYLGGYFALLGGCDAIAFAGGIGENSELIRARVCERLEWAGVKLDSDLNAAVDGETRISADDSRVAVWVVPTNEEIVVARLTVDKLSA